MRGTFTFSSIWFKRGIWTFSSIWFMRGIFTFFFNWWLRGTFTFSSIWFRRVIFTFSFIWWMRGIFTFSFIWRMRGIFTFSFIWRMRGIFTFSFIWWMRGVRDLCQQSSAWTTVQPWNENFYFNIDIIGLRRCLTKMKERQNARLETGRWVFGWARKPRLFWFNFWRRDLRHLFVSGSWYCQIQTTWLIMFFPLF